jgi:hypothetical protein
MRMKRIGFAAAFAAFAVIICCSVGCQNQTPPQPVKKPLVYDKIIWGDKIRLKLTVTTTKDKYLSGPSPVVVKIPGNCPLIFDQAEYRISRPIFPMIMTFEVPRAIKPGKYTADLGITVTFCNKADDTCIIRNDVLQVPFEVSDETRPTSTAYHDMEVEYLAQ